MRKSFKQVKNPHMKKRVVSAASGAAYFVVPVAGAAEGTATGAGDAKVKRT